MAQLGDTVITGSLAVSNCIYGSVTCATCSTTSTNACKGWNGSAFATFGSNAFNSTAFTTCTGTVTQVKIGTTAYNPTSGVICLPAYPSTPTCVCCAGRDGSGCSFGTAARYACECFRSATWTPTCVCCARCLLNSSGTGAYKVWISV